jgi:hypothetical protein
MSLEMCFLIAVLITLGISGLIVTYLQRPLRKILVELCGKEERAHFWLAYANILLLLVPFAAEMFPLVSERSNQSWLFTITDYLRWGLLGLIVAMFLIALGVATFILPGRAPVYIDDSRADDLQRLLAKVQELRAREIVERSAQPGGS